MIRWHLMIEKGDDINIKNDEMVKKVYLMNSIIDIEMDKN